MRNVSRLATASWIALGASVLCFAPVAQCSDKELFHALELAWMDALAAKDRPALERLLAPGFTIVGATFVVGDTPGTRANWLAIGLERPFPRHDVEILGTTRAGDTAVVHALLRATYPPSPFVPEGGPVTFVVTDTWIERDGRWQVLARHSSFPRSPQD